MRWFKSYEHHLTLPGQTLVVSIVIHFCVVAVNEFMISKKPTSIAKTKTPYFEENHFYLSWARNTKNSDMIFFDLYLKRHTEGRTTAVNRKSNLVALLILNKKPVHFDRGSVLSFRLYVYNHIPKIVPNKDRNTWIKWKG